MDIDRIKISVIVPCYKVEQYLEKCVNSVLASSFNDYEIILVDDGSPDRSGEIADELATRDSRIRVIHQKNGGVSKAREAGFMSALGKWITFVDSDDTITPNALEDMYKASQKSDTDIVIGFPVGKEFPEVPVDYSIEQYRADAIMGSRIPVVPWGRLIRHSIITPFMFDVPREVKVGEDMLFNIRCAFATNKPPVVLKTYVYNYNVNENSITQVFQRTPEYEQRFHEHRLKSVPKEKTDFNMYAMISSRLYPIKLWSYKNPIQIGWMDREFVVKLKEDIHAYSYPLSYKDSFMLNNRNKLIRMMVIPFFRIVDVLKRS